MKTNQAFKRVVKKLSAVRATLRSDERKALDNIIVDEVAAHKMNLAKTSAKATAKASRQTEVKAHKMNLAKTSAKATAKASRQTEVKAHKMNLAKTSAKTSAKRAAAKASGKTA